MVVCFQFLDNLGTLSCCRIFISISRVRVREGYTRLGTELVTGRMEELVDGGSCSMSIVCADRYWYHCTIQYNSIGLYVLTGNFTLVVFISSSCMDETF